MEIISISIFCLFGIGLASIFLLYRWSVYKILEVLKDKAPKEFEKYDYIYNGIFNTPFGADLFSRDFGDEEISKFQTMQKKYTIYIIIAIIGLIGLGFCLSILESIL